MSIQKNEIPILEFDDNPSAVINPNHEGLNLQLPEKCVFAFLGEYIDEYARNTGAKLAETFISTTKRFPIYITTYQGVEICLCQAPMGAAAAAQLLDFLIAYGVREIISAGSCGALEVFPEGAFLVPRKALRDEGASYHYAPPSRFIDVDEKARSAIEKTILNHGMQYLEVVTWSTDGFYRETKEKVAGLHQGGGDESVAGRCGFRRRLPRVPRPRDNRDVLSDRDAIVRVDRAEG